jgi:hypothetical protein
MRILGVVLGLGLLGVSAAHGAEVTRPYQVTEQRAACRDYDPLRQPFFGDTHVHTAFSFDAASQDTRATPADAYRFARGEAMAIQPFDPQGKGLRSVRLGRPLDFTAVTDHAEMLGEVRICSGTRLPGSESDMCWSWRALKPLMFGPFATRNLIARQRWNFCGEDGKLCLDAARDVWSEIGKAAEDAYDRSPACAFTSFIGYEWTGSLGSGSNLHHNVIFRNHHVPELPVSWIETPSASELWARLQSDCLDGVEGCDVLSIPHNSNLGSGLMFATGTLRSAADIDKPVTREEAERRARFEPLVEIMQHKGDSECLIAGDTTDEACAFEKLPYNSFAGVASVQRGTMGSVAVVPESLKPQRADMVREALKRGLEEEERLGVNPLKYGIIASTDTHLATPGLIAEKGHVGHGGAGAAAGSALPAGLPDDLEFNPGGLAVVWAEENTRDAIFSGMLRRETYGTSGPRMIVRLFGGWEYPDDLCGGELVAQGYAEGVPMGSDLPPRPASAGAPSLAISALRDPGTAEQPGAPLQRIQVIKGWLDAGKRHERVYDVAGGENGASVDLNTCERRGKGAEQLCTVWRDPDFDAQARAFYYVRVLENPSCRWSQHICNDYGVDCSKPETIGPGLSGCCALDHRPVIQERAWTSPIWYTP